MSAKENKSSPIAIVGIGCLFPGANDPEQYWANIREGVDAIGDIPDSHWKVSDYFDADKSAPDMTYAKRGGFINPVDFNPLLYGMSPNNIEATDTTQLLGMVVAREALLDAGYATAKDADDGRAFNRDRTSVILGVTGTLELVIPLGARLGHPIWRKALADAGIDKETAEDIVQRIADGYVPWQENSFPGLLGNVAAGRIANRFDLGGTNCVVDAACASSLSAIHLAMLELESGRVDMAITGGMDTFNDIFMYMCFSKTPALSPTGNSRPFARDGDGTILGEGLGAVIMKRLDDAKRDGDKIYAVLKGMGSSSDGRGNAIYAPSSDGQTKALWNAYQEADVTPRSIELVEAHGTGTSVGDAVEARALSGVYRQDNEDETWCAVGSVKSMIGHTKAAAGVAGLIKTAMALKHKVLPPSIKVDEPLEIINPGTAPIYLNTVKRPWIKKLDTPRRAALSSFGFGGSNFHCVLEEAETEKTAIDWDGRVLILPLSADDNSSLIEQLPDKEVISSWERLRFYAYDACQSFRADADCRLVLVLEKDGADTSKLVHEVRSQLQNNSAEHWQLPNAFYGSGQSQGKTAFVFPGQGSQYVGMGRDLVCQFPQSFDVMQQADIAFRNATNGTSLTDIVYPIPVFNEADRKQQEETLRQTQHAQPAIGAVSAGCMHVLAHFDIKPDAAAGHSYGELTALHAAGFYDEEALHYLSYMRGHLMGQGEGDRGAMLAVVADIDTVKQLLLKHEIELVIANHNAPEQVVLSGATDQIDKFAELTKSEKIRAIRLPVAAAFHSEFVADAAKPFGKAVAEIQFHKNTIPVLANSTTEAYPDGIDSQKKLLSEQLANPVRFVEQVEKLYADGVRHFIEVGPGKTLTGLIKAILKDKDAHTIAIDASMGKKQGQYDLALVLATLTAAGKQVALNNWDAACADLERPATDGKPAMTVPVSGANIMQERPQRPPRKINPERQTVMKTTAPQPETTGHANATVKQDSSNVNNNTLHPSGDLLQATQQSILALQKMQEQTARLHQQYLEGQETAQKTIHGLLQQQQALLSGNPMPAPATPVSHSSEINPATSATQTVNVQAPETQQHEPQEIQETRHQLANAQNVDIDNLLLKVVSEKTGYPLEMLSLDMSLDTDLGIDSIKRVEILSALQEKLPWSPVIKPEELGTFQFLQHIVEFVAEGMPKEIQAAPQTESATSTANNEQFENTLLAIVSEKTGYPMEMLELDMNLDSDLGIDSIKRVEILSALQEAMPELPTISADELGELQTLRSITGMFVPAQQTETGSKTVVAVDDGFANVLLEVVAEKTGYPTDMLSLEMSLDSDLGIDSIKRVEILSALQDRMPSLPAVNPDDMATLQTLQAIVDMFSDSNAAVPETTATASNTVNNTGLADVLLEVVADKTGYPTDMLNLEMHLDSDLGIDSIKRVEILSALQDKMPDLPVVSADELSALQTLQQIIDTMQVQTGTTTEAAMSTSGNATTKELDINQPEQEAPLVRSVVELQPIADLQRATISLDKDRDILVVGHDDMARQIAEQLEQKGFHARVTRLNEQALDNIGGIIICAAEDTNKQFILDAFSLLQYYAPQIKAHKGLLATVTSLGGTFGFDENIEGNAMQAGLNGMIKTADKEWSDVHCKCIDINADDEGVIEVVIDELILNGPLEIAVSNGNVTQPVLIQTELPETRNKTLLNSDDVIVISGGARGVTAEVAVALAQTYQCGLLLLGRSPEPEAEPSWLSGLVDATAIKQAILDQAEQTLKPAELEQQYKAIMANREIMETLGRIEKAGSPVRYCSADITEADVVTNAIDLARIELGNVSGIIHAAGVLADRTIEDKTLEQFDQVMTTKVDGLLNLLDATSNDDLKLIVAFSSTTARLGRKGQVDYAAANEILNKMAATEQKRRDNCRVLSVNWGPWDGGMVTPALKKLFKDEGVGVIGLKSGADYLVNEMESRGPVETVVLGDSNINTSSKTAAQYNNDAQLTLVFERELSVNSYSFLQSHVMNGQAVLPAAVIIEWFAHGALHLNPGMQFQGFDDFRILKGVTLSADDNIHLRILAGDMQQNGNVAFVPVELRSEAYLHAIATIVLADDVPTTIQPKLQPVSDIYQAEQGAYYRNGQLFHGQHLQGIREVTHCNAEGIVASVNAAPAPSNWMSQPIRSSWLTDPLALDSAFQLMILWSFEQQGIGSLPTSISRYRQYQRRFPKDGVNVIVKLDEHSDHKARATIEFVDEKNNLVAVMDGYECVRDNSLQKAFRENNLSVET